MALSDTKTCCSVCLRENPRKVHQMCETPLCDSCLKNTLSQTIICPTCEHTLSMSDTVIRMDWSDDQQPVADWKFAVFDDDKNEKKVDGVSEWVLMDNGDEVSRSIIDQMKENLYHRHDVSDNKTIGTPCCVGNDTLIVRYNDYKLPWHLHLATCTGKQFKICIAPFMGMSTHAMYLLCNGRSITDEKTFADQGISSGVRITIMKSTMYY